jgi:hypothetical protein
MLDGGRYASNTEMADAEKLERGSMGRPAADDSAANRFDRDAAQWTDRLYADLPSLMELLHSAWQEQRLAMRQFAD